MKNGIDIKGPYIDKNNGLDGKYIRATRWFSDIQLSSFNTDLMWSKISNRLENLDKKILSWFMVSAATCTMLVAAGLEFLDNRFEVSPNQKLSVQTKEATVLKTSNPVKMELRPTLSTVNSKIQLDITESNIPTIDVPIKTVKNTVLDDNTEDTQSTYSQFQNNLSFTGRLNMVNSLSPELGINIKVWDKSNTQRDHSFHLGYSIQSNPVNWHSESTRSQLATEIFQFVNFTYAQKTQNTSGWNAQVSYMLNPDGDQFKNHTVRASWHKNIGKHLGVGPEIIFTDNFDRIYPGLSVLFSS